MFLGNLTIEQIEERMGVEFPPAVRAELRETRQEKVNNVEIQKGHWHCFDIPFAFMCADEETARHFYELLKPFCESTTTQLRICW